MEKIVKQEFEINAQEKSRTRLDIKLFSQDVNTAIFNMSFTQDGEPVVLDDSYKLPVLFLFRKNGRKVMVDAVIKNGIATVVFDNRWITEWDIVDAYTYLNKDNQTIDANAFSFKVDVSKIDSVISDIKVYYIEDLEDLKAEYIKKMESINKDYQDFLDAYIDGLPNTEDLKGKAGTIDVIGIEVLEENEEPKVINSGTESSAKLTFQLPRGHQGIPGKDAISSPEIIEARNGETSLNDRLTKNEQEVTAQLAHKANLSEVRKDTMLQPITMAELSTEVKSGMTGGSVVGLNSTGKENIKTKAVTQGKTDFVRHGKNYFNKVKTINGQYRSYTNGSLVTDALQFYSDYIEVDGGLTYTVNKPYTHICFYDDNYVFISGYLVNNTEASKTFTTPINCRKLTVSTKMQELNTLQLEEGNAVTQFEGYTIFIEDLKVQLDKVIGKITKDRIEDRIITPLKTTFLTTGKNLLNKEKTTDNYRIAYNSGVKVADNNYTYTEHIAVVSGQTYVFNANFSHVCFYDENYNYLSGLIVNDTVHSFTVPDNAKRVVISFIKGLKPTAQLEIGAVSTSYESYYLRFVYDSRPSDIDMRLIEPYPAFTKPYIFNKKLYANGSGKPRTAVYTGVDAQVVPKGMRSKIRFLPGNQQGTVALISNQNGLTTVKNITDKSLHPVFTQTNANIGIFNGNGLENLKTVYYKEPCKVDGETEYEIGWSVEGNTISVTTPDGVVTTVTDDRIPLVMGRYCTFEHYWDGAMAARPIFSYFEVTDNTDTPIITDNFNRPDGEIVTAPTGQSYTTFHI